MSDENMRMAYCPVGFAHGFCVLSDGADVVYKQSGYYDDETERGIAYNDPEVGIEWPLPVSELQPSQRRDRAEAVRDRRRAAVRIPTVSYTERFLAEVSDIAGQLPAR